MSSITLKQLVSTTDELTKTESNSIMGGNFIKTITGITNIAGGIAGIGKGIISIDAALKVLSGKPGQNPGTPGGLNPQALAYQEFFAPDPYV